MNSVKKLNRIATHAREVLIYVILNTTVRDVKNIRMGRGWKKEYGERRFNRATATEG
jgi:hypothetical protein